MILKPGLFDFVRVILISAVKNHPFFHQSSHLLKIGLPEGLPLGNQNAGIRTIQGRILVRGEINL